MTRLALALATLVALGGCYDKWGSAVSYVPRSPAPLPVIMPADAPFIGQQFVARQEDGTAGHLGIDLWTHVGTPVLAAAPGRVTRAFFDPAYGRRITLDHGLDAGGQRMLTQYFHLSRLDVVQGDKVARGQQIAASGASGVLAGFPHLHFEVLDAASHRAGLARDPHFFWADGTGHVTCFDPARRYTADGFVTTVPLPCRRPGG